MDAITKSKISFAGHAVHPRTDKANGNEQAPQKNICKTNEENIEDVTGLSTGGVTGKTEERENARKFCERVRKVRRSARYMMMQRLSDVELKHGFKKLKM